MKKRVRDFQAFDDQGANFRVIIYQHYISERSLENANGSRPGLKEFRTSEGYAVNHKGGNKFEVLHPSDEITVTTDDPEFN